jgi:hypothetical protein
MKAERFHLAPVEVDSADPERYRFAQVGLNSPDRFMRD